MNIKSASNQMKRVPVFILVLIGVMTLPRFVSIYRTMAFNTVPRDDYAPYLLFVAGENLDAQLYSPYGYRFFSYAIALPFYKLLPVYKFSNLEGVNSINLAANQALALISYLSILAACYTTYLFAKSKLKLSLPYSLITAFCAYFLFEFTSMAGIDPIAIFFISICLYFLDQPVLFSVLMLVCSGLNEKIPFLFFLLLFARLLTHPKNFTFRVQLFSTIFSVGIYFAMRTLIRLPGFEHQLSANEFPNSFIMTLRDTFSIKGLALNSLPILLLVAMILIAILLPSNKKERPVFLKADIVPLVGLVLLAFFVRLEYTVGRIAMYCFPLYLPYACANLANYFSD